MLNPKTQHLLGGISDFFSNWFEDKHFVDAVFEGANHLLGQAYFDMVVDFLEIGIDDVDAFRNKYWKFLTFDSKDVMQVENPVDGRLAFPVDLPTDVVGTKYLYNRMFNPTKILENGRHYVISGSRLYFITDVFGINSGSVPKGIPYRKTPDGGVTIALWGRDVQEDARSLARQFGSIIGYDRPSTEQFKSFLRGVYLYYQHSGSISGLRSALNIMHGLPIVRETGEKVVDVTYTPHVQFVVTTTSRDYMYPSGTNPSPDIFYVGDNSLISSIDVVDNELVVVTGLDEHRIPMPAYVKDSIGEEFTGAVRTVELTAAQVLTTTFKVVDRLEESDWWHYKVFPVDVASAEIDKDPVRRTADPLWHDTIATSDPVASVRAGDPGLVAGANKNQHRKKAYILADNFWKHHAFFVERDTTAPVVFEVPATDLRDVIRSGMSPRVITIIDEVSDFIDGMDVWDIDEEVPPYDLDPYASSPGIKEVQALIKQLTRFGDSTDFTDTQLIAGDEFEAGYHVDGTPLIAGGTHPNVADSGTATVVDRMALSVLTQPVIGDHYPVAVAPGDEVTLIGYDFLEQESNINHVRFDGELVPATYWHTNRVRFRVPDGAATGAHHIDIVARTQASTAVQIDVT